MEERGQKNSEREKKWKHTHNQKRRTILWTSGFYWESFLYFESFFHCTWREKWYKTTLKLQIMMKGVAEKEGSWSVDRFPLKPKQDSTTDKATAAEDPEEIHQHRLRFRNKIKKKKKIFCGLIKVSRRITSQIVSTVLKLLDVKAGQPSHTQIVCMADLRKQKHGLSHSTDTSTQRLLSFWPKALWQNFLKHTEDPPQLLRGWGQTWCTLKTKIRAQVYYPTAFWEKSCNNQIGFYQAALIDLEKWCCFTDNNC